MPSPDTIQAVELPDYDDPPAIPDDLRVLFYALMSRAVPRFSNTAARDAAYPSPVDGQLCMTGSGTTLRMWTAVGGDWLPFARTSGDGLWAADMPPSGSVAYQSTTGPITSTTSWMEVPSLDDLVLDLPAPAQVQLSASFWMNTPASTDLRCGIQVSGASTVAPEEPSWGSVAIQQNGTSVSGSREGRASKEVELQAGENVISLVARRTGTASTANINYPYLSYQVVRWL